MSRRLPSILMLLVGGLLAATPGAAQPASSVDTCGLGSELHGRLAGLLAASDDASYRGTLLIEYNNDREFVAVDSSDQQGVASLTRLSRKAGAAAETVPLVSAGSDRTPCDLARWYAVSSDDGHVVAGRAAYRLTIRPRDTLRLGFVMDVDTEHHIPLRVVTATADGQVLERYEFADVELSSRDAAPASASVPSASAYEFSALPPGFSVVASGTKPVANLVVSDGLSAVSVFIEPLPASLAEGEGVVLRGATLVYTRGTQNDHLITVLGEVPVTTARLLADAIRATNASTQ